MRQVLGTGRGGVETAGGEGGEKSYQEQGSRRWGGKNDGLILFICCGKVKYVVVISGLRGKALS